MPLKKEDEHLIVIKRIYAWLTSIAFVVSIAAASFGMVWKISKVENNISQSIGLNRSLMIDDFQIRVDLLDRRIKQYQRLIGRKEPGTQEYKDLEGMLDAYQETRDDLRTLLNKARGNR